MTASTAIAYAARFVSFDDDFYYGMFVRTDEKGLSHHICTIKVQFDSDCEYVALMTALHADNMIDNQVFVDFEIDHSRLDCVEQLEKAIMEKLMPHQSCIHRNLKVEGRAFSLILLDCGIFM